MNKLSARLSLSFSCLGHATMHVLSALYLTVVLGLEREWGLGYDELIGLWTAGALLIGLGAPVAGWLGDRWSDAKMMVIFFLLAGGGAVAAALADGPLSLGLGLAVLGLGASIYHPVGMSWTIKNAASQGKALGVQGIFGSVGIASAAVIAGLLMDSWNWRAAFWIPGAVSIALGAVLALCIAAGVVVDCKRDAVKRAEPSRSDALRAFFVLSVTMVCAGLIFQSTMTAMPKWFGERMTGLVGDGLLGIGGLVTAVYLVASLSQFFGGMLCDRFPLKLVYGGCLAIQVPLLVGVADLAGLPLLALATVMVLSGSLQIPAENLLLARYTPAGHRGLAFGAKFILAFGVAPLGIQLVALTYGWTGSFYFLFMLLGSLAAVAFVAAMLLPSHREDPVAAGPVPAAAGGAD